MAAIPITNFEKKMLMKKISGMSNLPIPSAHVMKVMLLLRDDDVLISNVIEAIERDQTLVAQIIKLVNSGYYGLRKSIDTVERAVNLLGILTIKQVIYSATIMDIFGEDQKEEWNHAYSTSQLMNNMMKENEIPVASNLPLTMLMHDIGKVVLRRFSPKKYEMAAISAKEEHLPVFVKEEDLIKITHSEVGGMLLKKWDMTEDIIQPVIHHHTECLRPGEVPEQFVVEIALTQFVNWVDHMARGTPATKPSQTLLEEAGFEEIDKDYWIGYQRDLIEEIEGERPGCGIPGEEPEQNGGELSAPNPNAQTIVDTPDDEEDEILAIGSMGTQVIARPPGAPGDAPIPPKSTQPLTRPSGTINKPSEFDPTATRSSLIPKALDENKPEMEDPEKVKRGTRKMDRKAKQEDNETNSKDVATKEYNMEKIYKSNKKPQKQGFWAMIKNLLGI